MESKDKSDKDFQAMPRDQQFLELVRRKLRKANKKMQRIAALEATLSSSKANVNEEQKKLLASKETTSLLIKEFTELQNQMTALLNEKKEGSVQVESVDASNAAAPEAAATKQHRPARKDRKRKEKPAPATTQDSSNTNSDVASSDNKQEVNEQGTANGSGDHKNDAHPQGDNSANSHNQQGNRGDKPPKQKKEWEVQRDVYNSQFKSTFTEAQQGKFVGVCKGSLIGPFDTQEELAAAAGGDKKDPGMYLAQIGNEEKNPIKRGGQRRGSGSRNGGRGGSGRRDGASGQQGGFSNQRRGGNQSNNSQGRTQA